MESVDPEVMRTARYVRDKIYEEGLGAVRFTVSGRRAIEAAGGKTVEKNIGRYL
ncbi:hypothetical protein M1M38_gp017 [Halorubrum tailed virus 27]|uniref:Uncharacterized protein n=1 Tax=Halorubrum tailed virus 27 TaxID=2878008 RepID=A0AAE8XXV7_9CAUD|nr:hypothetical protein M1M38_gp017 [Halorubrum tailed virus 27]UBF22710.1 hypothetical protein HRTV-27_gp17 [Halorubrum tailed virus 27]